MRSQQDSAGGLRHLITLDGLARDALTAISGYRGTLPSPAGAAGLRGTRIGRRHRRELVFRTQHPHTRLVRPGQPAPRGPCPQPGPALQLARQGREHARHDLYARGDEHRCVRHSRLGSRHAGILIDHVAPHVSVISAGEAHVSHSHPRVARRVDDSHPQAPLSPASKSPSWATSSTRAWPARRPPPLAPLGTTDVRLVAPQALLPEEAEFRGAQRFTRIEDGIAGATW